MGWLNTVTVENVHPNTTVALRMNGLSGAAGDLHLYAYGADGADGALQEVPSELWNIQSEDGSLPDTLEAETLYEVHMTVEDGGSFDLDEAEKEIQMSAVLAK